MGIAVQARLDEKTRGTLDRLVKRLGWSRSEVIRAAIQQFEASRPKPGGHRIIGTGQFQTGIPDLATNKKHMEGFGR